MRSASLWFSEVVVTSKEREIEQEEDKYESKCVISGVPRSLVHEFW